VGVTAYTSSAAAELHIQPSCHLQQSIECPPTLSHDEEADRRVYRWSPSLDWNWLAITGRRARDVAPSQRHGQGCR